MRGAMRACASRMSPQVGGLKFADSICGAVLMRRLDAFEIFHGRACGGSRDTLSHRDRIGWIRGDGEGCRASGPKWLGLKYANVRNACDYRYTKILERMGIVRRGYWEVLSLGFQPLQ